MNYIGEKIKELRKKQNMTQEKLAEFLSVSYQTVSKWECGVSSPDVYMIAPLARLFGVTTDELLGVTTGDARRAEFDADYDMYWQKDMFEIYERAKAAVAEFPGDMKYLEWLASMEYYMAFDDDYQSGGSTEHFNRMLERSVSHYKTVIENATDGATKESAVCGIAMSLKYLGRLDEAREYAALMPENAGYTRDAILNFILSGDELWRVRQRIAYKTLCKLLMTLNDMNKYTAPNDKRAEIALELEETIIKAFIPDGNYLGFYYYLYQNYMTRAEFALASGDNEAALRCFKQALEYAKSSDSLYNTGKYTYTAPIFEGYEDEWKVEEGILHDAVDYCRNGAGSPLFDAIRDNEAFKELIP